jgi:large repetitive protein
VTIDKPATPPPPAAPPAPPAPPAPTIDLAITKSGSPDPASVGNRITWTMVVTNNGPSAATGVTVGDPVPAGTTFVSATSTQGTCAGGAVVTCQIGGLAAGASATITLVTTANATGTLTNTATAVGKEQETNTANNTATAKVTVKGAFVPPVVYCTAVAVTPKSLFVGRANTLTLKVSQHGKRKAGVKIRIRGASIRVVTKPSNRKGIVKRTIKPTKAGIVTFSPLAAKSCKNPRVGVIGVFTPPVTG